MKTLGRIALIFLPTLFFATIVLAVEKYPSGEKPEPSEYPKGNTADVVCKCDPTNDPCCIPPIGTSSNKTTKSTLPISDVSTCKCIPEIDPCCKKIEGTSKVNKGENK